MISKEKFIEYMGTLEKLCKTEEKINAILSEFGSENQIWFDKHETLIVNILRDMFDDQKNNWIGYSIYEMDWFRDWYPERITDKDGKDIPLANAGDLYDLLMAEIN